MNKIFIGITFAALSLPLAATAAELETQEQKLAYIIGMDIGNSLKQQGTDIDLQALFEAIEAIYNGEEPAMTAEEAAAVREAYIAERRSEVEAQQAELAVKNAAAGDAFLLDNRNKEGVMVTESGLQYEVITEGDGPTPTATDRVRVHYRGTLLSGDEFDSSYSRGEPATFVLNQVIPGWTEGLQLMPVGSKYKFYIPGELAYGASGGRSIEPNSTLIFEVELLGIEET
ncbi:MAG TPA: FKBP-type peptidyl-prolyl cis-trans isomerase [Xanthomonadales bacterium]|nr:FKBP-type peptidyl-prolyl cis-trans isomerase [Xanthomonadales bacterium]